MTAVHHTFVYIGNFQPTWSTENHVAASLEANGHRVLRVQENAEDQWRALPAVVAREGVEVVLWTRTWALWPELQRQIMDQVRSYGVGWVGYHLDRWWGLGREHQVHEEPFFRCDLVVTADGGHDEEWAKAGVEHLWMPPAVYGAEARIEGQYRPHYDHPVVWVGNWARYHPEWPYRRQLVRWLRQRYRDRLGLYPKGPQLRGTDLNDLYASCAVVVGDSCLAGGATHYWSDRIPEVLGRGGFLIHPYVPGIEDHYTPGKHLVTYELGNFAELARLIAQYAWNDHEARRAIAAAGREHVLAHHTYERRMEQLVDVLHERNLLVNLREASGRVRLGGLDFDLRPGSSDGTVLDEVWRENVYRVEPADVAGGVVVDWGANIGAFALWAARNGAVRVVAYEPHPDNYARLKDHLDLNRSEAYAAVSLEAAVLDAHGEVAMDNLIPGREGGAAVSEDGDLSVRTVDANSGLAFAAVSGPDGDDGEVAFLKVDIEGSEYVVFEALDPEVLRCVRKAAIEFHPTDDMQAWGRMLAVLADVGHVEVLGGPTRGGYIYWRRYES